MAHLRDQGALDGPLGLSRPQSEQASPGTKPGADGEPFSRGGTGEGFDQVRIGDGDRLVDETGGEVHRGELFASRGQNGVAGALEGDPFGLERKVDLHDY